MSNPEWKAWIRRLQQGLGALLADTVDITDEQWTKVPDEVRELVQGAIELEAEAAELCSA